MKHTINALVAPFIAEDPSWNITILKLWLTRKKGIPEDIADYAIQTAFVEIDEESKRITTHHGSKGFDNFVLNIAQSFLLEQAKVTSILMEEKLNKKISDSLTNLELTFNSKIAEMEEKMTSLSMSLTNTATSKTSEAETNINEKIDGIVSKHEEQLKKLDSTLEAYKKGSKLSRAWKTIRGKL